MLAVISPAKTLDFESALPKLRPTRPAHLEEAAELIRILRQRSRSELEALMGISAALADLNWQRYRDWEREHHDADHARPALFAFKGDVYTGFSLDQYGAEDFRFAQGHLRILSGLYGLLRPLDFILPYRLEMGTALKTARGRNLYEYWGEKLSNDLNAALAKSGSRVLVNLASQEYFGAIQVERIRGRVLTPHFREWKNGDYRIVSFYAKKARGLMSDYLIRQGLSDPEELKHFDLEGYRYQPDLGDEDNWYFTRGESR